MTSCAGTLAARFAAVMLAATACSSSSGSGASTTCSASTTFPAAALDSLTGASGKVHVELRSAPDQPLTSGVDCVELRVTDPSTSTPIDGLTVVMTPWMTAMGHGASVTPQIAPLGQGRYVVTNVALFMSGEWELRTQFSGPVSDSVNPTFNVN